MALTNWITSMGSRPDLLAANLNFAGAVFGGGQLPPSVKQMILMTLAYRNDCKYCAVAHTHAIEAMGVPKEVIESCASDPELADVPAPQRAILNFALKAAKHPQDITDEDVESLREQNLGDGEIAEIVMTALLGVILWLLPHG